MDQGEIRRGSRRGCDGEIRLSEGNGIDRYNEDTGVEIFADPLEWSRRTGIVDSKRILQLDVWNIKTPMLDILGDGEIEPNSRMLVRAGHEINTLLLFPPGSSTFYDPLSSAFVTPSSLNIELPDEISTRTIPKIRELVSN